MAVSVSISGIDEARQILDVLPDKLQAQVLRKMFKKAAQPVIDDARSRVQAHDPGYKKLAAAIGFIPISTSSPTVIVGVRAKGQFKDVGFYGHWVEYGVSGIKSKSSKTLTKPEDESFRFWVSSVKKGGRYRNDIPPQPYMRPAVDSRISSIQANVSKQIGETLYLETEKAVKRYKARDMASAYSKAKGR